MFLFFVVRNELSLLNRVLTLAINEVGSRLESGISFSKPSNDGHSKIVTNG